MRTDEPAVAKCAPRVLLLVSLLALASCASTSTREDVRSVNELVRERRTLATSEPSDRPSSRDDPEVDRLLGQELAEEDAVRIALLNSRDLRAELLELGVARGQLVQASLWPNPEVEAEARFSEDPAQNPQWDVGIGFDLTRALLRGDRRDVATAELEVARVRAAAATLDLGYRVRVAYLDVQAATQELELLGVARDAFLAGYETAATLHAAGNVPDLELTIEHAAYEEARVLHAEGEARVIEARERLNVLLGLFGRETTWNVSGRLAEPSTALEEPAELEARAVESSLELLQARRKLDVAARRRDLTRKAGVLPDIEVGVHAEHDGTFWEVGPELSAGLPVFDRKQGDVASREAEWQVLRERYEAEAVRVRATVRAVRARALSAEARARHYRDVILPLRARLVDETVLQTNAMQVGIFQLIQARRDQITAARAYVGTLHEYWRARAALDQVLAGRLVGTAVEFEGARAGSSSVTVGKH